LNLLFCGRGFGLMVSVVVPLMLAVLPYARGCGFDSRSRLMYSCLHMSVLLCSFVSKSLHRLSQHESLILEYTIVAV
jgi:hypothetical protein